MHNDETTEIYTDAKFTYIHIKERKSFTEIEFRNVGTLNIDASIQFSIREYNTETNRSKSVSFSIPEPLAALFIEGVQRVKQK